MLFSQAHRSRATSRAHSAVHRQSRAPSIPNASLQRAFTFNWCCSTFALLKWVEIVLCIVLVTLIEAGVHLWRAYGFIMFVSAACAAVTFAGLAFKFCQIQTGRVGSFPFDKVDLTFNIFAIICFSIAFGLACYDCVMIFGENKNHHDNQPTSLAAYEDWRNRIVGVTVIIITILSFHAIRCFLNSIPTHNVH
ncbi:hypothetical protein TTRE_0000274901 [Trichuris trichiura]|uniref:MARVEL domain-containing protein n=1 Tax=Trichuris trichiura TaxID=36087 RepID=A0A077Z3P7_TRITR|nr:hypothetical protein TTRE_0000274901 [Trichuris trichiura]